MTGFQILNDALSEIPAFRREEEIASFMLSKLSEAVQARAGTVFILEGKDRLSPVASFGAAAKRLRGVRFKVGRGVVGWAARYRQPVKVDQPASDPRFDVGADKTLGFQTDSIIACPMLRGPRLVGAVELLNSRRGAFTLEELDLLSSASSEIGAAIEHWRLLHQLRAGRDRAEGVLDACGVAVFVVDGGQVVFANPPARALLGPRRLPQRLPAALAAAIKARSPVELRGRRFAPVPGGRVDGGRVYSLAPLPG